MTITIHAPTQEALEQIDSRLCAEDVAELTAGGYETTLDAINTSVASSREVYVAHWYGKPQAVFGIADFPDDDQYGVPWMLSTGPRGKIAAEFVRVSQRYIAEWKPLYSALFNFVDSRHLRAQRWLLSLGFRPFKVHDINGHPFIEFGVMC